MSLLDKNKIIEDAFSYIGKVSAEKYNIISQAKKIKEKEKKKFFRDFFSPDIDKEENKTKKRKIFSFEDLRKAQTPKQREKIKKDIKKYLREHNRNKILNPKKILKFKNSSGCFTEKLNVSGINSVREKKLIHLELNKDENRLAIRKINIKGLRSPLNKNKFKYHNKHMNKQLEENKNKANYNKNHNDAIYYPNFDYLYNI